MTDFGELALVVGDFHIPHRAVKIPEKFQRMLVPNKMQREFFLRPFVLILLNLCRRFMHGKSRY